MRPLLIALALSLASAGWAANGVEEYHPAPDQADAYLVPREAPVSTLVIGFDVGSADDITASGITRLTQHAMLEANARVPYARWTERLFAASAQLEIHTAVRSCSFQLSAPSDAFEPLAVDLLRMVLAPRLVGGPSFERAGARTIMDQRLANGPDLLSAVAGQVLDPRFQNPPNGADDGIADVEVKRAQLDADLSLSAANARVVMVGRFDPARIKAALDHLKGGIRTAQESLQPSLPLTLDVYAPAEIQVVAMPVHIHDASDSAALRVAASLIGEELEKGFRGAGVSYSYSSEVTLTPWMDALWVILPAHDPSGLNLKPFLLGAIERVRKGQFAAERFEQHRRIVAKQLAAIDADPLSLATALNDARGLPWVGEEVRAALAGLTPKVLTERADRWLRPERGLYVQFGPSVERYPTAPAGPTRRSR